MPYGYSSLKIQLLNILINKIKENNQGRIYREKVICDIGLMITVSGCGSNKSDNETTQSSQNVESKSVKDIYASVSTMAEGKLTELDPQYLSNYYGIDTADLDEYVFAQSDTPESSAETIIIIKSADTSKFDSYKTSFENYKKQKSQELTNYNLPDQAKLVDKSKVVEKGNYLYLVISKNADEIIDTIEKNI